MSLFFKENRKEYDKITQELLKANNAYVLVGFPEGTVTRSQSKGGRHQNSGLSVAEYAAKNEFGDRNVPARPFMRPAFDENKLRINQNINRQYQLIVEGKTTTKKALSLIGLDMVSLIQKQILSIHYPPNSPRTIAIKKSSKPLIDFGQMISSVTSKVVLGKS